MIKTNLGAVTAYAEAVKQGYTGTREEFGKDQAAFAGNAQQVASDRAAVEAERKAVEALLPAIEEKRDAATQAIEEKGAATKASIPEDYAALAAQVSDHEENKLAIDRGNLWNGESEPGYITSVGSIADHTLTVYTKPIYLHSGSYLYRRYTNMFGSNAGNVFKCDAEGAVTAVIPETDHDETLGISMVTLETGYYCFNISVGSNAPAQMVIAGDDFEDWPDEYRTYGDVRIEEGVGFNAGMQQVIETLNREKASKEIIVSLNLWNGEYVEGYYVSTGTIKEGAYQSTKPIYLAAGTYIFSRLHGVYGSNSGTVLNVTKDDVFVGAVSNVIHDEALNLCMVTLSEGYYKFNAGHIGDEFMLIAGDSFEDWPDTYQTPGNEEKIEPGVKLNDAMREEVAAMTQTNPLYGKIIAFEGDSICAGAGYSGGYGKIIAERNEMEYYNTAVGGGVMPSGILTSSGSERHGIAAGVAAMNPDADYLIFEGGVNDTSLNLTLGEIAEGYPEAGESDTLDTTTFLGAFESACRELVTTFAGKKVGYIFVHGIFASDHRWNTLWRGKMKEILVKWGVPYLDLQEQMPPLNLIPALKETYTANGDGWHPNELGYTKYYCDKIEAWLKTL